MLERYAIDLSPELRKTLIDRMSSLPRGTTEYTDLKFLNKHPELLNDVKRCVEDYVDNADRFDIHLVKSWAVVTQPEKTIEGCIHNHGYAHLAFVIYLQQPIGSGNIVFELNNIRRPFATSENMLIIFPACLPHQVPANKSMLPRYSIAGDIILTLKNAYESSDFLTPVEDWLCLS